MAFVDHEFALLSVGARPATRSGPQPAGSERASRKPSRKQLRLPPGKTLRAKAPRAFAMPARRQQFRPGR